MVHLCLAQWPLSSCQPASRTALEDQVKIPDKLADQIYESFHCPNWMCIAWCMLLLFNSHALFCDMCMRAVGKRNRSTSSSPCVRHLILLWENPAQTYQLGGIMLLSETIINTAYHYISLFYWWKRKKKHGPVQKANKYIW